MLSSVGDSTTPVEGVGGAENDICGAGGGGPDTTLGGKVNVVRRGSSRIRWESWDLELDRVRE